MTAQGSLTFNTTTHQPEAITRGRPWTAGNRPAEGAHGLHLQEQGLREQVADQQPVQAKGCLGEWAHQQPVIDPTGIVGGRGAHVHACQIGMCSGEAHPGQTKRSKHPFCQCVCEWEACGAFNQPCDEQVADVGVTPTVSRRVAQAGGIETLQHVIRRP
ncbi:hypothetical protein D3C76_1398570 [compost metagenome]